MCVCVCVKCTVIFKCLIFLNVLNLMHLSIETLIFKIFNIDGVSLCTFIFKELDTSD